MNNRQVNTAFFGGGKVDKTHIIKAIRQYIACNWFDKTMYDWIIPQTTANTYPNIILWGDTQSTKSADRNFLFLEHGLFNQTDGMYVDTQGFFSDSSICNETNVEPTESEKAYLDKKAVNVFGNSLYQYEGTSGPVLLALQKMNDKSFWYVEEDYYDLLNRIYQEYKDCEVVVRPHPKDEELDYSRVPMAKKWRWDDCKQSVYKTLPQYSRVVAANSTLLIEAAVLGLQVRAYGHHVFDGYDLSDRDERTKFLCAVLRHHVSYKNLSKNLWKNSFFRKWYNSAKKRDLN